MFIGILLIIIGAAFLLQHLDYLSAGTWGIIWPAILIVIGLRLLFKKGRGGFFWEEEFGWRKKEVKEDKEQ